MKLGIAREREPSNIERGFPLHARMYKMCRGRGWGDRGWVLPTPSSDVTRNYAQGAGGANDTLAQTRFAVCWLVFSFFFSLLPWGFCFARVFRVFHFFMCEGRTPRCVKPSNRLNV